MIHISGDTLVLMWGLIALVLLAVTNPFKKEGKK
jgi:hypothetical protein